ncbi:unnamed protein product [Scytosiphon promiscuus]
MWKPDKVVPEHKRRALAVWVALLLTTIAYTIWQIVNVAKQYENPSTTLRVSDDLYDFPSVKLCFSEDYGCHDFEDWDTSDCAGSAGSLVYFGGETIDLAHTSTDYPNCIEFDLSTLEVNPTSFATFKPSAYIKVDWTASTSPADDTSYREMIGIVLGDFETYVLTYVPYARTVFPRDEDIPEEMTIVTIQKTQRRYLSGDGNDTFTISTIATSSTAPYDITEDGISQEERAVGRLELIVEQAPYSLVEIWDDPPLSVGNLLGNIGGFWELLLVAWGVFFISARRESEPEYKARNLSKSIKEGRAVVSKGFRLSRGVAAPRPADTTTEARTEARPDWEAPYRAAFSTRDSVQRRHSTMGVGAGDASAQTSVNASFWRRPVESANPSCAGHSHPPA